MRLLRLKIVPEGPFHFGQRGVGIEETEPLARSDTIFSALCHNWLMLYGEKELEALLARFLDGDPPFLLSSAFPYAGEVYFLPRPLNVRGETPEMQRKVKKIGFISTGVWNAILEGKEPELISIQRGALWLTREELEGLPEGMLNKEELTDFYRKRASFGVGQVHKLEYAQLYYVWRVGEAPHVAIDRLSLIHI